MPLLQGTVCGTGAVALLARSLSVVRGEPPGGPGLTARVDDRLVERAWLRPGG